jgi:dynein heavy chain
VYNYIDPKALWDAGVDVSSQKIMTSIEFCNSFKTLFYEYKEKVNQKSAEKQWRFENINVFQRFNSFIERLQDLLDIVQTIQDFSQLEKVEIGGIKGDELSIMINHICQDFSHAQKHIQSLEFDFLDIKNQQFDKEFYEYRTKVKDLDKRLWYLNIINI